MTYKHVFLNGGDADFLPGKAVCVGRNYAEHAKELNNPIPSSPMLFIKPASAFANMAENIAIPSGLGDCHHELEVALLIGKTLSEAKPDEVMAGVLGYGLALDLTLRDLQSELKKKGHPWERAKAFDGACPLSPFVSATAIPDWCQLQLRLTRNGQLQQEGQAKDMIFGIEALLSNISHSFTLNPGDIVLTGTPAGVGPLRPGDQLKAELLGHICVESRVI